MKRFAIFLAMFASEEVAIRCVMSYCITVVASGFGHVSGVNDRWGGVGVVKLITGILILLGPGASEVEDGLICLPREVVDNLDLDPGIVGWSRIRG